MRRIIDLHKSNDVSYGMGRRGRKYLRLWLQNQVRARSVDHQEAQVARSRIEKLIGCRTEVLSRYDFPGGAMGNRICCQTVAAKMLALARCSYRPDVLLSPIFFSVKPTGRYAYAYYRLPDN